MTRLQTELDAILDEALRGPVLPSPDKLTAMQAAIKADEQREAWSLGRFSTPTAFNEFMVDFSPLPPAPIDEPEPRLSWPVVLAACAAIVGAALIVRVLG